MSLTSQKPCSKFQRLQKQYVPKDMLKNILKRNLYIAHMNIIDAYM